MDQTGTWAPSIDRHADRLQEEPMPAHISCDHRVTSYPPPTTSYPPPCHGFLHLRKQPPIDPDSTSPGGTGTACDGSVARACLNRPRDGTPHQLSFHCFAPGQRLQPERSFGRWGADFRRGVYGLVVGR